MAGLAALLLAAAPAASASDEPVSRGALPLRWAEAGYRWQYSRAVEPAWLDPGVGLRLFERAAEAWAACGVRIEFAGETDRPVDPADGVNVVGWSTSLPPRLRGITYRRAEGGRLREADVAINAANRELRAQPRLLEKVVLHEFGHALGLVHSPDCGDVMSLGAACPGVTAAALPERPTAGDLAQCALRYGGAGK